MGCGASGVFVSPLFLSVWVSDVPLPPLVKAVAGREGEGRRKKSKMKSL
jgi:hypothetical protein